MGCMVLGRTFHIASERRHGSTPIVPIVLVQVPVPVQVPDTTVCVHMCVHACVCDVPCLWFGAPDA